MMTFEELLARAAEPTLQGFIGRPVTRLLARLDPALIQPERLREVVQGLRTPQELLMSPETRRELLMLLPPNEAGSLASRLGLSTSDSYASLEAMRVGRNSRKAEQLLDFFSVAADELDAVETAPDSITVMPQHGLFPHQRQAARRVLRKLTDEPHRVLLHMPTGSGKTRTAMNVICQLMNRQERMLVVWLAHSEELCEQAVGEFEEAWQVLGNRAITVSRWWGDHTLESPARGDVFLVAGLAKIYAAARRDVATIGALAGAVGLVVMDEAHQAIAPTYQHVLSMLTQAGQPAPLLGLSATPGRTWNDIDEDEKLADFFFGHKVPLEVEGYVSPIDYLVDEGYLARTHFESLHYSSGIEFGDRDLQELADALDIPPRIVKQLAEDEQRNLLIVNKTELMAREHERLLVFAATVDHARLLATVLRARGLAADAVTGTTPAADRARLIAQFRSPSPGPRVLVNYGVLTTGFDAPRTSAAVIARPTKSLVLYSQMVGRATRGRRVGGNEKAEVATVVDTSLPGFASMTEAFHNWEDVWTQDS